MEIKEILINKYNFKYDTKYELTKEIKQEIMNILNISINKLGKELNNHEIFEYNKIKEGPKNNQIWKYYVKLLSNQDRLREFSQAQIDDNRFEIIKNYLGIEFIMLKQNRYVNITKLCMNSNKKYNDYKRTEEYKQIYESLINEGILEPAIEILNVSNNLRGTYVHEELAIVVATWISIEFFRKVTKIISNYMKEKHEYELKAKDYIIENINKNLEELKISNEKLQLSNEKILENNNELKEMNKELLSNSKELLQQNKTTQNKLDNISQLLENLKENIVPEDDWSIFVVFKIKDGEYYVIRTMKKYLNKRKKSLKEYEQIYEYILPSSIQYFSSFKNKYKNVFDIKKNTIKLCENKSEDDLLYFFKKFHVSSLKKFLTEKEETINNI